MRVVYANARYDHHSAEGGQAHMRQFIENAVALGHELHLWHGGPHPLARKVPDGRLARLRLFRRTDLIYSRVEFKPPMGAGVMRRPVRRLLGDPLIVWEFNTVPEYARVLGIDDRLIERWLGDFRRLAGGVDLAICVSRAIEQYVRKNLGIERTLVVPNGSDPQLFRPDVPPVARVAKDSDRLNVVWIGSANLVWHNFDLLRDAARLIWNSEDRERIAFHLIGPGMRSMRDAPPNMHYHGPEEYALLPSWLSAMHVGLNVYRRGPADFSSPLKVFDYMASGLTVVSTEQPQVRELFEGLEQLDLMVPTDGAAAMARVLRTLASDRPRLARQGSRGRQLILDQYNWRTAVATAFGAIQKLRKPI